MTTRPAAVNRPQADPGRRVLGLLGLAARAGMLALGTTQVREAARQGRVRFVLIAADASANASGKLVPLLEARGIAHRVAFDRVALGTAAGKAPLSAIGVSDASLAERIRAALDAGPATGPANPEG